MTRATAALLVLSCLAGAAAAEELTYADLCGPLGAQPAPRE